MDLLAERILIIRFKGDLHLFPIEMLYVFQNYRMLEFRKIYVTAGLVIYRF
jgi:hypothetical protein